MVYESYMGQAHHVPSQVNAHFLNFRDRSIGPGTAASSGIHIRAQLL